MNTVTSEQKLFNFHTYFQTKYGLWVYGIDCLKPRYQKPIPYSSLENLKPALILKRGMSNEKIIQKLGGEAKVRSNTVDMSQIAQLIDNQRDGQQGVLLNNGFINLFYVIGINDELITVFVYRKCCYGISYGAHYNWIVNIYRPGQLGYNPAVHTVFGNNG